MGLVDIPRIKGPGGAWSRVWHSRGRGAWRWWHLSDPTASTCAVGLLCTPVVPLECPGKVKSLEKCPVFTPQGPRVPKSQDPGLLPQRKFLESFIVLAVCPVRQVSSTASSFVPRRAGTEGGPHRSSSGERVVGEACSPASRGLVCHPEGASGPLDGGGEEAAQWRRFFLSVCDFLTPGVDPWPWGFLGSLLLHQFTSGS